MNLLLLLALAVPLSCLAFLSLLAVLGVMMLGGVIHLLDTIRARRPLWPNLQPANNPNQVATVGAGEQFVSGHLEAERSRHLQVDELDFGRLRDRQLGRRL
jgi:hypothetical protein